MRRRRDIKGLAYGFASHFVSRNNDVDGYLAMGVLYKHAIENGSDKVEINLFPPSIKPKTRVLDCYVQIRDAQSWADKLKMTFDRLEFPSAWLKGARVTIIFKKVPSSLETPRRTFHAKGRDYFTCIVDVTDDENRTRRAIVKGRCRPHDPNKEWRSWRAQV
jgi:hypothetical protein